MDITTQDEVEGGIWDADVSGQCKFRGEEEYTYGIARVLVLFCLSPGLYEETPEVWQGHEVYLVQRSEGKTVY